MNRDKKFISQEKSITDTTTKVDSNIQKFNFDFIDKKINDKDKMQEKE